MPDEVTSGHDVVEEKQPEELSTSKETPENLPEDSSERTREQFEKLKQHNKELAEENRRLKGDGSESVFGDLRPKTTVAASQANKQLLKDFNLTLPQSELDKLMDEEGYIDPALLKKALTDSQATAQQALTEAKRMREEFENARETEQVKQAHGEFPLLNPRSTDFNQKFFDAVKNEMMSQMIRGEKDLVAAARKVAEWFPITTSTKPVEPEKKELQIKQANLTGTNPSRPQEAPVDNDLQRRMWKGDRTALLERLKKAGL